MTGAPLPAGADAVIMREEAEEAAGQVRFRVTARPGQHIRRAGEDVRLGDVVLPAGATIGAGRDRGALGAGADTDRCASSAAGRGAVDRR